MDSYNNKLEENQKALDVLAAQGKLEELKKLKAQQDEEMKIEAAVIEKLKSQTQSIELQILGQMKLELEKEKEKVIKEIENENKIIQEQKLIVENKKLEDIKIAEKSYIQAVDDINRIRNEEMQIKKASENRKLALENYRLQLEREAKEKADEITRKRDADLEFALKYAQQEAEEYSLQQSKKRQQLIDKAILEEQTVLKQRMALEAKVREAEEIAEKARQYEAIALLEKEKLDEEIMREKIQKEQDDLQNERLKIQQEIDSRNEIIKAEEDALDRQYNIQQQRIQQESVDLQNKIKEATNNLCLTGRKPPCGPGYYGEIIRDKVKDGSNQEIILKTACCFIDPNRFDPTAVDKALFITKELVKGIAAGLGLDFAIWVGGKVIQKTIQKLAFKTLNEVMEKIGREIGEKAITKTIKLSINMAKTLAKIVYRDWETDRKSTRLNSSHRL